jgi:hypothetical protein
MKQKLVEPAYWKRNYQTQFYSDVKVTILRSEIAIVTTIC